MKKIAAFGLLSSISLSAFSGDMTDFAYKDELCSHTGGMAITNYRNKLSGKGCIDEFPMDGNYLYAINKEILTYSCRKANSEKDAFMRAYAVCFDNIDWVQSIEREHGKIPTELAY